MDTPDDNPEDWMEVVNVSKLVNFSRKLVYFNFDHDFSDLDDLQFIEKIQNIKIEDEPEVDQVLPYKESLLIFNQYVYRKKKEEATRYSTYIKDEDYDIFLEQLSERMVSNIIHNLVNKGFIETAFDNDRNEFIFWVKKDTENGNFPTDEI
jgi:hypothetical protein